MIIKEIKIAAFGKWEDKTFTLDDHFTKIIGDNESGKTTIREFIKAILYGYANNKMKIASYKPKSGKKLAGSLVVRINEEDFEIFRDEKDLQITNLSTKEKILDPKQFLDDYLGSINRETFENSFEFSIQQLAKIQSLKASELETSILNVGIANAKELKDLEENFEKEASNLYKPKGSLPPINQKLVEYEELLAKRKEQADVREEYQSLLAEKNKLDEQIKAKTQTLAQKQEVLMQEKRLADKKALFDEYQSLKATLSDTEETIKITDAEFLEIKNLDNQEQQLSTEIEHLAAQETKEDTAELFEDLVALKKEKDLFEQTSSAIKEAKNELAIFEKQLLAFPKSILEIVEAKQEYQLSVELKKWKKLLVFDVLALFVILCCSPFFGMFKNGIITAGFVLVLYTLFFEKVDLKTTNKIKALFAYKNLKKIESCQKLQIQREKKLAELKQLEDNLAQLNRLVIVNNKYFANQQSDDYDLTIYKLDNYKNTLQGNYNAEIVQNKKAQLALIQSQKAKLLSEKQVQNLAELEEKLADIKSFEKKLEKLDMLKLQLGADFVEISSQQNIDSNTQNVIQELNAQLDALRTELAQINNKLAYYNSSKEYLALNQKIENFKNDLVADFNQYFSKVLSAKLIENYMSLQSEDRYPKMLALANDYFKRLTNNYYQGIQISKNKISLVDQNKKKYELKELSTATSEQLYISFKIAFAKVVGEAIKMPMIIDDGFVNFDLKRKEIMLAILKEISLTNQVIFFALNDDLKTDGKTIKLERN